MKRLLLLVTGLSAGALFGVILPSGCGCRKSLDVTIQAGTYTIDATPVRLGDSDHPALASETLVISADFKSATETRNTGSHTYVIEYLVTGPVSVMTDQ